MEKPKYNRIVLKLSGEALAGEQGNGINPTVIQSIAKQVKEIAELDVEVAVVVGGGNLWRGKTGSDLGIGPCDGRLYGHACYCHELTCPAGQPGNARNSVQSADIN